MLGLDFAYARLSEPFAATPVEMLRAAEYSKINLPAQELRNMLGHALTAYTQETLARIQSRLGLDGISLFPALLGIQGEIGVIVVGSERADFPTQTESLLLSVATNQASIGLQEVRLLREQTRIASELDRRVAERTAELAEANEELRVAHAQVLRSEERWRSVFENSAVGVALTNLSGRFVATNPVYQKMLGYTEDELQQLTYLDITHEENVENNRLLVRDLLE
jgi:PAS domain-containing protein